VSIFFRSPPLPHPSGGMRVKVRRWTSVGAPAPTTTFWDWVTRSQDTTCAELAAQLCAAEGVAGSAELYLEGYVLPGSAAVCDVLEPDEAIDCVVTAAPGTAVSPHVSPPPAIARYHETLAPRSRHSFEERGSGHSRNNARGDAILIPSLPQAGTHPCGLCYCPDFLTASEEADLVAWMDCDDGALWSRDISRRTQQYGPRFDYGTGGRRLLPNPEFPTLPDLCHTIATRLQEIPEGPSSFPFPYEPDQVIVNEYEPGQGINPHVDRPDLFTDCVAVVSLLSPALMAFAPLDPGPAACNLLLAPRSALLLRGPARYHYTHSIPRFRAEISAGGAPRQGVNVSARRISITFRRVPPDALPALRH